MSTRKEKRNREEPRGNEHKINSSIEDLTRRGYCKGSVVRVLVKNFLTYDHCEAFPGPRLNVVIGPNGTGKSTLNFAICLACGGTLEGRSTDTLVKHGKENEEAFVEVDLFLLDSLLTVRRVFSSESKGSKYFINGSSASSQTLAERMAVLNIDMENICSFMPQDKVGSFSQLSPEGILTKTLQSIQIPKDDKGLVREEKTYYDLQQELSSYELHKTRKEKELSMKKNLKDSLETQKENMKTEIDRIEFREEIKKQLEMYKIKSIVLECDEAIKKYDESQIAIEEIKNNLTTLNNNIQPLEITERNYRRKFVEADTNFDSKNKLKNSINDKKRSINENCDENDNKLEECVAHSNEFENEIKQNEKKSDDMKNSLENLNKLFSESQNRARQIEQERISNSQHLNAANEEVFRLKEDVEEIKQSIFRENSQKSDMLTRLNNLNNESQKFKMRLLKEGKLPGDVIKAIDWFDRNNSLPDPPSENSYTDFNNFNFNNQRYKVLFRGEVWGPLAMHLSTDDIGAACIIEKCIPWSRMLSWVTTCKQDSDIIRAMMRNINIKIDIVTMENINNQPYFSPTHVEGIGFQGSIISKLKADPVLIYLLSSFHGLDRVLWSRLENQNNNNNLITPTLLQKILPGGGTFFTHKINGNNNNGNNNYNNNGRGRNSNGSNCNNQQEKVEVTEYRSVVSRFNKSSGPSVQVSDVSYRGLINLTNAQDDNNSFNEMKEEIEKELYKKNKVIEEKEKEINNIRNQIREKSEEVEKLQEREREFKKILKVPQDIENKIKSENQKLKQIENKLHQLKNNKKNNTIQKNYINIMNDQLKQIENYLNLNDNEITNNIELKLLKSYKNNINIKIDESKNQIEIARESIKNLKKQLENCEKEKNKLSNIKKDKEEILNNYIIEKFKGSEKEFEKKYIEINNFNSGEINKLNLSEIKEKENSLQYELDCIVENPQIIKKYNELTNEINKLNSEVSELSDELNNSKLDLEKRSNKWLTDVRNIIKKVNGHFKKYMRDLQFDGEVSLLEKSSFDKYEVEMKVRFRENGVLTQLSANRHSGGERAVLTVMYLMSLHDLTSVPFRIMDEINQGMDERNERLVFDRIVRSCINHKEDGDAENNEVSKAENEVVQKATAQHFLVSPKLLNGLRAMGLDGVTVLLVLNGPGCGFDWQNALKKHNTNTFI